MMSNDFHPAVRAAARTLKQWYGIEVPDYRLPLLAQEMAHVGGRAGVEAALERLLARDSRAWDAVIDVMTVPETYLFRHFGHFVLLRELAERRHREGRSCRVLSAGCSSGEEAWSAAAILASTLPSRTAQDQVVGWDINERRLEVARQGRYRDWSARAGLQGHDAHFVRDGAWWEVARSLRSLVTFERVNLVGELPYRNSPFDAIFFRNVGIYWDHATSDGVVRSLARHLVDDGLLLVGPSDPGLNQPGVWEHVIDNGVRHYRRRRPEPAPAPEPPASPSSGLFAVREPRKISPTRVRAPARPSLLRPRTRTPSQRPFRAPAVASPDTCDAALPPAHLDEIQGLADAGQYERALSALDRLPPPHGVDVRLWRGILLLALDEASAAVQSFKQCVYLEPNLASHRRWLAVAYESAGRADDAARENRNALELASP
jgi:chemotaxis protein methyltransferase CheR